MPWIQIKLNACFENAEAIGELLMDSGALSATFTDAKDTPIFEPLPGETRLWGDTDVTGLYEADEEMISVLAILNASPLLPDNFSYKIELLEDKDWEREWMDKFHPMKFGKRLWICPSWKPVPDETAVNVMLDPGLAFGTGTHPTTALCLTWLDGQDLTDKVIIDFGCGSGILAIVALKLGAKRVIGIDIDPQAILASRDNAQRNNVSDQLELYLPEDLPQGVLADVLVANILAGPLRELSTHIEALVKPNGLLALSGILEQQAGELIGVYSQWFKMNPANLKEEWAQLSGEKSA
ncbi:MAG TPA: 50S ribosomal protein L11 methyltransferase [Psychromonas hadalis]|nr:50S ribosomal protein L11 methyltransferase [Psychromonas hadalis]